MRTFWRPDLPPDLIRSIGLVCLADAFVGLAFGAITIGAGLPLWLPVVLSLAVYGGAAQFLFVGVVGAGGGPVAPGAGGPPLHRPPPPPRAPRRGPPRPRRARPAVGA